MPADPGALELFGIATGGHEFFDGGDIEAGFAGTIGAPLPFSVVAVERGQNLRQLFFRFRIIGSGKTAGELEEVAFAGEFRRKLNVIEAVGFLGVLRGGGVSFFVGVGGDGVGVKGDEIVVDPGGAAGFVAEFEEALLSGFDEFFGFFGSGRRAWRLRVKRSRREAMTNSTSAGNFEMRFIGRSLWLCELIMRKADPSLRVLRWGMTNVCILRVL